MIPFTYASWNLKNLSTNSINRQWTDFETGLTHENLHAYTTLITEKKIDVIGFLEVTIGSGEAAVIEICNALNAKQSGAFASVCTQTRTFITRTGEYNAVVYGTAKFNNGKSPGSAPTYQLFPNQSSCGTNESFLNRVPVLFKMPFKNSQQILQVITWHCPQPAHVRPAKELTAFAETLNDCLSNKRYGTSGVCIDEQQPLLISGDFNFNTDPKVTKAWNDCLLKNTSPLPFNAYLQRLTPVCYGKKTTLIRKDPTISSNPTTPTDFDDLLCNAYDAILIDSLHVTNKGNSAPVINHLQQFIAQDKVTLTIPQPGSSYSFQMLLTHANKISDHCMIYGFFETK